MATLKHSVYTETTEACNTLCIAEDTRAFGSLNIETMIIGCRGHVGNDGVWNAEFVQRFYFNKTPCFPLCAPIHLQFLKLSFSI